MKQIIYIVEDDENIRELVSYALVNSGFQTLSFEDANALYTNLSSIHNESDLPNLLILDIMLPKEDGLSILKKLKSKTSWQDLPVIMLTAKGSEIDKIKGLDMGADDYITKPFSVMELVSRINALLRRTGKPKSKKLSYENISLDNERHIVTVNDEIINLTLKEYDLLYYLLKNSNLVFTREKLIETVWGYDFEGESRTIDMHIKTLRQKLATTHIKTIRGVGYKLGQ